MNSYRYIDGRLALAPPEWSRDREYQLERPAAPRFDYERSEHPRRWRRKQARANAGRGRRTGCKRVMSAKMALLNMPHVAYDAHPHRWQTGPADRFMRVPVVVAWLYLPAGETPTPEQWADVELATFYGLQAVHDRDDRRAAIAQWNRDGWKHPIDIGGAWR